jgi:hypothetical protein
MCFLSVAVSGGASVSVAASFEERRPLTVFVTSRQVITFSTQFEAVKLLLAECSELR